MLLLTAVLVGGLVSTAAAQAQPTVSASDLRVSQVTAPSGADTVSATTVYSNGTWYWYPQMVNFGPGDTAAPSISLDTIASQWTGPGQPALGSFPVTFASPSGFPAGTNFPYDPAYSSIDRPFGFHAAFHGPATTGFDASLTLASPSTDVVPSGGTTQTWTLSMTVQDPSLTGSQLIVDLDPTAVGGAVDGAGVVTTPLNGGETLLGFDTSSGALGWSILDPVLGKTYTLSVPVDIPNTGGPFSYRPYVDFEAAPPIPYYATSSGASVAIPDSVLGGTFTFSVASAVDWEASISEIFDGIFDQAGPTYMPTRIPASCNGTYLGSARNVTVPSGASCTLVSGSRVGHDLTVEPGGSLEIGGVSVGHDLTIAGAATVCGSDIGHDLEAGNASGDIVVGGGPGCDGNRIGHDLSVDNDGNVTVTGNQVGHDLSVQHDLTATVTDNQAGHDAACTNDGTLSGSGNEAGHHNSCPH